MSEGRHLKKKELTMLYEVLRSRWLPLLSFTLTFEKHNGGVLGRSLSKRVVVFSYFEA